MCTQIRWPSAGTAGPPAPSPSASAAPAPASAALIASSKSFAVTGSIVNVGRPRRSRRGGAPAPELVAMALSPTGKWLYGGTDGGCVWAWEAATGAVAHRPLPSQRAHRGAVVGLAAHPWRALLLSWGTEGDVKSWLP